MAWPSKLENQQDRSQKAEKRIRERDLEKLVAACVQAQKVVLARCESPAARAKR